MKRESYIEALNSLRIEAQEVTEIRNYIDGETFGKCVDALAAADRVITCASGTSGIAAKKFAHTLCCIEKGAQFMPPCEAVHGGLGAVKQGDVVVFVSRGGKTAELMPVIEVCRKKNATVILVTENDKSPMAAYADIILAMKIGRESDIYNFMATSSFLVTVALFDALIAALMVETGYKKEMFALIHPGGAVGQKLNKNEDNDKKDA